MVASAASPTTEWSPVGIDPGPDVTSGVVAPVPREVRSPRRGGPRTPWLLALGDGATALAAAALAAPVGTWSLCLPVLWVAALHAHPARDAGRVVGAALSLAFAVLVLAAVTGAGVGPAALVGFVAVVAAVALGERVVAARLQQADVTRVVLVGDREGVDEMGRAMAAGSSFTAVHSCLVDDDDLAATDPPDLSDLRTIVAQNRADAVVVVPSRHLDPLRIRRIGWELERDGTPLMLVTALPDLGHARVGLGRVGDVSILHVRHAELRGPRQAAKRVCERALAAVALVSLTPVLLVLAAAVRLESDGPAFFRQTRIGRNGHPFTMLKLRTMCADAEARRGELTADDDSVLFKLRADPRVTRVGRFLRAYSLDELPQLVNIVRGEMALVGPRPPLPSEVEQYDADTRRRLAVTPGLTGLWQVSGRSDLSWQESVRLDLRYVEHWSIALDLRILARTVGAVLGQRGAY